MARRTYLNAQFFFIYTSNVVWITVFSINPATSKLEFVPRLNYKFLRLQSLNLFVRYVFSQFGSVKDQLPLG